MQSTQRVMIINIVNKILESPLENKEEYFGTKYPNFKNKYPVLFKTACDGTIDMRNLEFMMNALAQMEMNGVSQYDASAQVGQMLYERYVEPTLEKIPTPPPPSNNDV